MIELSRCVRLAIGLTHKASTSEPVGFNTFAGWPTVSGLFAWSELEVSCRGTPDSMTGYLINIARIDSAVRVAVIPYLTDAFRNTPETEPAQLLRGMIDRLSEPLAGLLHSIRWRLTPYHSVSMTCHTREMVLVREQFEFAAAHRLNCRDLSDTENREMFGKCNNPSSHGHNYRLEVAVAVPLSRSGDLVLQRSELQRIVHDQIIERFDHKNLDLDTAEFSDINSSVENISRICHKLIVEPIRDRGGELETVTVWETHKTCSTYPAGRSDDESQGKS